MEAALKAIAEPNRRRILTLVRDGEMSAGDIAAHFDVTGPAISQHLKVLKEAGLVAERRAGPRRLYSLRRNGLRDIKEFLESFWADGLERLKYAAEAEERKQKRRRRGDT
ncbi:MAG: metalloregulator ArsR/SmtB family transcription factor [Actinomycetota bacterium]